MANPYFRFKQFTVYHDQCAMKVTTDGCLFGAWCAEELRTAAHTREQKVRTVLDIGTGSGLISLMVAQKNEVIMDAIELDPLAAAQAQQNCADAPFAGKIRVIQKDVLELDAGPYDCIISNPPFYESELQSDSARRNMAHHSHQLSWKELFASLNRLLSPDGSFFLLLPFKRAGELPIYLQGAGLHAHKIVTVRQSVLHPPFRLLVMGSRFAAPPERKELSIWNEHRQYTREFTSLLRDYYLYL